MMNSGVKGTIIPIGGNEDKGTHEDESNQLSFVQKSILARVIKECNKPQPLIVVITTASSIPLEVGEKYKAAFGQFDLITVHILDIREKAQCENPENLSWIEKADCVMFSGGNQSKITRIIRESPLHHLIMKRYQEEKGFVIAGTSAGAMSMSADMITGGKSTEALFKGAVKTGLGMGYIPNLIIDSHFIQRGRFGRLMEAVARFPHLLGVGLAEDTGLVIKNCNECEVIGSGMVVLVDPTQLTHNHEEILEEGTPMSLSNLIVHVLSVGDHFRLDSRELEILPMNIDARQFLEKPYPIKLRRKLR
ncbi:cyanophycinase [Catalinimonas alkaloidigena]|uniref:cyanophycinase n=1 Tax=Catalinimonas alkaloidigena TaxID=1075417 RepID=UPI00240755BB|nr:cyanophycinase [Catalinimonas alkaloidigena]MDF9799490.1 cyanophycinase [Catalinimonas alkaloidigena]